METRGAQSRSLASVAGILLIIDGGLKVLGLMGILTAVLAYVVPSGFGMASFSFSAIFVFFAIVVSLLGIFTLICGVFALQRKRWGVALAGSIVAALPFSFLGIAALIMLILSRQDFTS